MNDNNKTKYTYMFFSRDGEIECIDEDYVWPSQEKALAALKNVNLRTLGGLPWTLQECRVLSRITITPAKLRISEVKS